MEQKIDGSWLWNGAWLAQVYLWSELQQICIYFDKYLKQHVFLTKITKLIEPPPKKNKEKRSRHFCFICHIKLCIVNINPNCSIQNLLILNFFLILVKGVYYVWIIPTGNMWLHWHQNISHPVHVECQFKYFDFSKVSLFECWILCCLWLTKISPLSILSLPQGTCNHMLVLPSTFNINTLLSRMLR